MLTKESITGYDGTKLMSVFHEAANQEKSFDPFYLYFSQVYEKAYGKYTEIIAWILVHGSWLTQRWQMN